jgi:hypothetical protein
MNKHSPCIQLHNRCKRMKRQNTVFINETVRTVMVNVTVGLAVHICNSAIKESICT